VVETIGIACGALAIALLVGTPCALVIAVGGPLGGFVRAAAALVRAIPDVVLAIVFVVALGLGPLTGTLALGVSGAATVAKLYSELLQSVRREPMEAMRATGAPALVAFLVGLVPAAWPGLIGFGAYAFESIARSSVIVGVVGAGGIGNALMTSVNTLQYHDVLVYVIALALLVMVVDAASGYLRAKAPPWVALAAFVAVVATGVVALARTGTPLHAFLSAPARVVRYLARAIPPDFSPHVIAIAASGALETIVVAIAGTLGGALLALVFAAATSRALAVGWIRGTGYRPLSLVPDLVSRVVLTFARSIPPVALALVVISTGALGAPVAIVALIVHTTGVLGKLFAESLELSDLQPAEALVASGASASSAVAVGLVPAAIPAVLSHLLYRFEWNVRASTTLGIVGAGALGQTIFNEQQLGHDRTLLAYVIVAVVLVLASDFVAGRVRAGFALRTMRR
jgi:phosphonate transport system permease protein